MLFRRFEKKTILKKCISPPWKTDTELHTQIPWIVFLNLYSKWLRFCVSLKTPIFDNESTAFRAVQIDLWARAYFFLVRSTDRFVLQRMSTDLCYREWVLGCVRENEYWLRVTENEYCFCVTEEKYWFSLQRKSICLCYREWVLVYVRSWWSQTTWRRMTVSRPCLRRLAYCLLVTRWESRKPSSTQCSPKIRPSR